MSEPMPDGKPGSPMPGHLPAGCAAVEGDLVELALGTLTGKARMVALAHLDTCARCSSEVEALSAASDQLVLLAPEAEPPVGLEARVFERLGLPQAKVRPWPLRLPRRTLVAAAAIVVVLVFAMGVLAGHMTGAGPSYATHDGAIERASMESNGEQVGNVMVYAGNPTWLFMYLYRVNWSGTLRCQVAVDDGPPVMLGRFWLSDGRGAWATSVNLPAGRLVQARVLGARGQVLAVANLTY